MGVVPQGALSELREMGSTAVSPGAAPFGEELGACRKAVLEGDTGLAAAAYLRIARASRGELAAQALAELARLHLKANRRKEAGLHLGEALAHVGDLSLALALRARMLGEADDVPGFFRLAHRALPRVEVAERERLMDQAAELLLDRNAFRRFAKLARAALVGIEPTALLAGAFAVAAHRGRGVASSEAFAVLEPMLEAPGAERSATASTSIDASLRTLGAHLLCGMADEAIARGDGGRAYHLFGRAIALDPELGSARVGQGRLLLSLGHPEEAIEILKPAPAQEGGGEAAWAVLGRAFLDLGQHHHAQVCAERAGAFARKDRDLWRLLQK